jgi:type I restriction enzyme S subunit
MEQSMSNWQKINLDKLCFFEKGKTGLAKAIPGDYPLVTTSAERKTNDSWQFDTKAVCIPLVSSTGHGHASLNYVHYQEGKFALGTILVALIPKDETILNAQFLHLYLSRLKDMILVPLMSGAANVSLSISKIKTVEIPLPPIDEQLKIVELFKNLVNENNELVEEINTQQSLLKQLKQTILKEAIEGKLTAKYRAKNPDIGTAKELLEQIKTEKEKLIKEKKNKLAKPLAPINEDEIPFDIPSSWEWCRLGEIIQISDNLDIQKKLSQNEIINYVDIDAINNTTFTIDNIKIKPVKELSTRARRILKKDFIVYSTVRPYLNNIAIVPYDKENLIGSTGFIVFKPFLADIKYFFYFLLTPFINDYYLRLLSGFNSPSITNDTFYDTLIPVPSIEEQKEIVATIEKLFAICDELEAEINQNKTTVDNLMATVLKEAFGDENV